MKRKKIMPGLPVCGDVLCHTGVFGRQPVERLVRSFAKELCGVLDERTRVTMRDDDGGTWLTLLTGEVIVSIHVTEGRMVI